MQRPIFGDATHTLLRHSNTEAEKGHSILQLYTNFHSSILPFFHSFVLPSSYPPYCFVFAEARNDAAHAHLHGVRGRIASLRMRTSGNVEHCWRAAATQLGDLPAMLGHKVPSFEVKQIYLSPLHAYYCQNGEQVSRTVLPYGFQLVSRGPPGSWHAAVSICTSNPSLFPSCTFE